MTFQDEPMPLKDLPEFIKSTRENGQTYVPVVDMGRIITPEPSGWFRRASYASAICLLLALGGVYAATSTKDIEIVMGTDDMSPKAVASLVEEGGGRVFSVKQENNVYKVRVLTLGNIASFMDGLRRNKEIERIELKK